MFTLIPNERKRVNDSQRSYHHIPFTFYLSN